MSSIAGLSLAGLDLDLSALEKLAPAERKAAEAELLLLEEAFRRNPLLGYRPHSKQVEFHSPPFPPLRAFFGGNRSGKSTAATVDTIFQALDHDALPAHLRAFKRWDPPFFCRFVTPDLGHTLEGVILRDLRRWCPADQLRGGGFEKAWDKQLRLLWFKNGSWFQFLSNEMDLNKFGGSALHRVVYDEEPREDIRSECIWRLIDYDGEEIFAMTPLNGMSFMFDEVYEPWERGKLPAADARVTLVSVDENPHLSPSGLARAKKKAEANPLEREARLSGRFVNFAGLVYPEFSSLKHVVPDEDEVPEGVECFEGIDPGMRHMAAVLFCYLDSDDRLTVYDEIAAQGKTVAQVAKLIKLKRAQWNVVPRFTVIDPASRNRNPQTGRSDQQEYADHGVYTIPGQNAVRPGINRVKERLEANDRLNVARRCEELRNEFRRYRWPKKNSRSENDAPEKPVKKDDHLLDVLRYICMQRPLVPRVEEGMRGLSGEQRWIRKGLERMRLPRTPPLDSGPGMWA